ncbi:MAG: hypothetical protein ACI30I_01565 [Parabacteroides sp.]
MKLNQDFIEAMMMLSFIILVLIGTSDFDNIHQKEIWMAIFGVIAIAMIVLKIKSARHSKEQNETEEALGSEE